MSKVTPIIRTAIVGAVALAVAAGCVINPPSGGRPASAPRINVTERPSSGVSTNSVWVVSAVGLNVRSDADVQATRLATLTQGVRLDISERRKVGPDTWLHVKSEGGGIEGWVLDQPELVIHRSVSLHVEQSAGWSMLFPAEWSPASGNPATFTGSSARDGGSMLVQTADDPAKLSHTPLSPGQELRQESPIEVYGRTTFITLYKLEGGGYEYDVALQFPKSKVAYLFDLKQPASAGDADTTLFKQLLASVIVPGEG